jgi:ribosome-binding protein aMBF1 (putative translation factor)
MVLELGTNVNTRIRYYTKGMTKEERSPAAQKTDHQIEVTIRQAMSEQGLTHASLAQRLGIKAPSVTRIITGKTGIIPQSLIDVLEALSLELTVQPSSGEPVAPSR